MEYSKFKELVKGGEKVSVDFKIGSGVFLSDKVVPRAELAKDICAMANNGNVASYLAIGVSDDGKSFKSVSNPKLTEENVQSFCKTAIFPPPRIKVHRECWSKASPQHKGKVFVIIQVGPHARQAFRLARDFVNYKERVCLRRNEVWIRRGKTSDIATPEEVGFLVKGKSPDIHAKVEKNIEYSKLPRQEQNKALLHDFSCCIEETGGLISGRKVVIPIRRLRFVFDCSIFKELPGEFVILGDVVGPLWQYSHGVLLLVRETVSRRVFRPLADIHFKEQWGYFTCFENIDILSFLWFDSKPSVPLPVNMKQFPLVIFTLPNIKDTKTIRNSFFNLMKFFQTNQNAYEKIRQAREFDNSNLKRWLKQGWLVKTNRSYIGKGPKKFELEKNEVFDRRYGNSVLLREKSEKLIDIAKHIIDLSQGKLP